MNILDLQVRQKRSSVSSCHQSALKICCDKMGLRYLTAPRIDCDTTRVVLLSAPGSCCDKRGTRLHSCRCCSSGCDKLKGSRVEETLEDMELNSFLNLKLKKYILREGTEQQDCRLFTHQAAVRYLEYPLFKCQTGVFFCFFKFATGHGRSLFLFGSKLMRIVL